MAQDTCVSKEAKPTKFKQWRKDGMPARADKGEVIGGGWFIFKRNPKSGRVSPSQYPFEHADQSSAVKQAARLAELHPTETFVIVCVAATLCPTEQVAA